MQLTENRHNFLQQIFWIFSIDKSLSLSLSLSLCLSLALSLSLTHTHTNTHRTLMHILPGIWALGRRKEAKHILVCCVIQFSIGYSFQFSSVAQSCPTVCHPMNCSMPDLPVHHQLPEFTQTHIHQVGDAIQPSHPLSSPSPPAPNPSQHQSLFQ